MKKFSIKEIEIGDYVKIIKSRDWYATDFKEYIGGVYRVENCNEAKNLFFLSTDPTGTWWEIGEIEKDIEKDNGELMKKFSLKELEKIAKDLLYNRGRKAIMWHEKQSDKEDISILEWRQRHKGIKEFIKFLKEV